MTLRDSLRFAVRVGLFLGSAVLALEAVWIFATAGVFVRQQLGLAFALVRYTAYGAFLGVLVAAVASPLTRRWRAKSGGALLFAMVLAAFFAAEVCVYVLDIAAPFSQGAPARRIWFLAAALSAAFFLWVVAFLAVRSTWRGLGRRVCTTSWLRVFCACAVEMVCALVLLRGIPAALTSRRQAAGHPNVLLIVLDTVRADALSCSGNRLAETPYLDRLASEGVRFARATSSSTWTPPGHASLFTGLYPVSHGTRGIHTALGKDVDTLASILRQAGYRTVSFYNNPLAGRVNGFDRGFDTAIGIETDTKVSFVDERLYYKFVLRDSGVRRTLPLLQAWIEEYGKRGPWLAFLNLNDAHTPYTPRQPWMAEFLKRRGLAENAVDLRAVQGWLGNGAPRHDGSGHRLSSLGEAEFAWLRAAYYSEVRNIDEQLRLTLGAMRRDSFLDDTVIVVTSDHGEAIGENGEVGHARRLVAGVVRIPMIFWAPGRLTPRVDRNWASLVDVLPTVLHLAKVNFAPRDYVFEGADLFAATRPNEMMGEHTDIEKDGCDSWLLLRGSVGLLAECGKQPFFVRVPNGSLVTWERASLDRTVARSLERRLAQRRRALLANHAPRQRGAGQPGPETWERLRALGYVQ